MDGTLATAKTKNSPVTGEKEDGPQKIPWLAQLVYGSHSENKSKPILLHDHGVGSPCGKCQSCEGLELHFWRKVCKNCGCKSEDHDVKVNNSVHEMIVYNLLNMTDDHSPVEIDSDDEQLLSHPMVKNFERKNKSEGQPGGRNLSQEISLKMAEIQHDENNNNEGADNSEDVMRQQQIKNSYRQIPVQDFDPKFCHNLDHFERKELKYFRQQVQEDAIGKAVIKNYNNLKNELNCSDCQQVIRSGSSYFQAQRLPGRSWHPACLKCFHCKEILAGSIYFAHGENIYCGRHYGQLFKSRCAACDELIFTKTYINAEEVNWHSKHFCCFKCDQSLGDKLYVMISMQPYCVPCYHDNKADRCLTCQAPIQAGTQRLTFNNLNWHINPNCFSCMRCRNGLVDRSFVVFDQELFCSEDCLGY